MSGLRSELDRIRRWIVEEEKLLERYLANGMHAAASKAQEAIDELTGKEAELREQLEEAS
jgi:hypothetical protein